jgi:hypothetical protein
VQRHVDSTAHILYETNLHALVEGAAIVRGELR